MRPFIFFDKNKLILYPQVRNSTTHLTLAIVPQVSSTTPKLLPPDRIQFDFQNTKTKRR